MGTGRIVRAAVGLLDRMAKMLPKREPQHLETGRSSEEAALFHLRELGYTIVAQNWRTPGRHGEIDLIGWDDGTLCFVEVKTRKRGQWFRRNFRWMQKSRKSLGRWRGCTGVG